MKLIEVSAIIQSKKQKSRHDPAATSPMTTKPDGGLIVEKQIAGQFASESVGVEKCLSYLVTGQMIGESPRSL